MQHAVNTAEDMLTAHQIEKLTESFNSDGTAKTYYIILPDGRKVDIPVACLTPSTNLSISELELEFAVKVDGTLTKGEGTSVPRTTSRLSERKEKAFSNAGKRIGMQPSGSR